jgi:hypothetical protein
MEMARSWRRWIAASAGTALARPNARPTVTPAIPTGRHRPRSGAANAVARPTPLATAKAVAHFPTLVAGRGLRPPADHTVLRVDVRLNNAP